MPEIQKHVVKEKSVKYVDHLDPVTKPIEKPYVTEIVPYHVKHFPEIEHVI